MLSALLTVLIASLMAVFVLAVLHGITALAVTGRRGSAPLR